MTSPKGSTRGSMTCASLADRGELLFSVNDYAVLLLKSTA